MRKIKDLLRTCLGKLMINLPASVDFSKDGDSVPGHIHYRYQTLVKVMEA
jgi:hypothetical protein